jgi:hypothetical protein
MSQKSSNHECNRHRSLFPLVARDYRVRARTLQTWSRSTVGLLNVLSTKQQQSSVSREFWTFFYSKPELIKTNYSCSLNQSTVSPFTLSDEQWYPLNNCIDWPEHWKVIEDTRLTGCCAYRLDLRVIHRSPSCMDQADADSELRT